MKKTLVALFAATLCAGGALARPGDGHFPDAHHRTAAKAARKVKIVCPVTGEKIASVDKSAGKSAYKGKTYAFCCPACKPKFDKDPAKYIKNSAKGVYEKM